MIRFSSSKLCATALLMPLLAACLPADPSPEQLEFFEKRIRPLLSDTCYKCHSEKAEKLKGGLMLDSREAMLKGGDTGPALVPGNPEKSLLIEAIHWTNSDLQMPPKKRLPAAQVADLEAWVKAGAPWPQEARTQKVPKVVFNLDKRKADHWCWKPVANPQPPAVKHPVWLRGTVDQFILAKLEEKGLVPAPDADRVTLIRRASFDITGLPPAPADVESFMADTSPDAFAKVVDRLLASPAFGERWARHWLDLVRYAETRGHEFDPEIPNAWQYRDYVIRAFNAGVPYNQFALEHIAGDLIKPRLNAATGANESILGTGFWFLGEEVHSPVDIRQDETDRMDNRLDVMSKTFLSLTVACARCHDHKFDAISQRDYTALTGFLISSSYRQARFETMENEKQIAEQLDQFRKGARQQVIDACRTNLAKGVAQTSDFLLAAREVAQGAKAEDVAPIYSVDTAALQAWVAELTKAKTDAGHPFHAFAKIAVETKGNDPADFARRLTGLVGKTDAKPAAPQLPDAASIVADFRNANAHARLQDGVSFGPRPLQPGDPILGTTAERPLLGIATRAAAYCDSAFKNLVAKESETDTGTLGSWQRAGRTIRTADVALKTKSLWYLVKGPGRAYAAVNSHLIVKGPLHGALLKEWKVPADRWQWVEHPLAAYEGHRVHVEFSPQGTEDFAIAMVVQSATPPPLSQGWNNVLNSELGAANVNNPETLANAVQRALSTACGSLGDAANLGKPGAEDRAALADWLVRNADLFCPPGSASRKQLTEGTRTFIAKQSELIARIRPDSRTAPAMFDGGGTDEFLLTRGSPKLPGAPVPRRFMEAISGPDQPAVAEGSGRLELARKIIDPANPVTARAIVNRVWHHLFGRGIVATVDNFGALGQAPSHPELLDHLASRFTGEQAWSVKKLIRDLMLSRTYKMSSHPMDPAAEQADPENLLLHRMNLRRLEGEAIRDAILAVSGRLNPKAGGPSVPVNLTAFMDGRGRPGRNGPLDGDGRRSIYIAVRRNFLPPMMLAFDAPIPFNTVGRRNVSNVPSQALILMNDPFVVEQAKTWASHLPAADAKSRIAQMYLSAFSRQPSARELSDATAFLKAQSALYEATDPNDPRIWADLCHVLFNAKEFIYLN